MTGLQPENEKPIQSQKLNPWVRWPILSFFVGVIIFITIRYFIFIADPQAASPSSLGLPTIFVFSSFVVLILIIPFEKLGLKLTKIGPVEFEKIIQTQATETSEVITELESRIDLLEHFALDNYGEISVLNMKWKEPETREMVLGFLRDNDGFYSPVRIKHLSRQQGLAKLQGKEISAIKRSLRELLNEGLVESTISQKGNTIYKLSNE